MQVPADVSLRVIVGCHLQPAFPGARPLIRWRRFPAVHLTSQAGLEAQVTSPVLATATTWPVPAYLPRAAKPTTGPKVLIHLPAPGGAAECRFRVPGPPGAGGGGAEFWACRRGGSMQLEFTFAGVGAGHHAVRRAARMPGIE